MNEISKASNEGAEGTTNKVLGRLKETPEK
jgi:hypothetical protein